MPHAQSLCLAVLAVSFAMCSPYDHCPEPGFLSDTALPRLCLGDTIAILPTPLFLHSDTAEASTTPADADGGVTQSGPTTMTIVSTSGREHQPRESAHIELIAFNDVDLISLEAVPMGGCELISSTYMRCELRVDGSAQFLIRPDPTQHRSGSVMLQAISGDVKGIGLVTVVGDASSVEASLEVASTIGPFENLAGTASLICTDGDSIPQLQCGRVMRSANIGIELPATVIPGRPAISLTVDIRGDVDSAFLSRDPSCSVGGTSTISFGIHSVATIPPLYLCSDERGGTFRLSATLSSVSELPTFINYPTTVKDVTIGRMPVAVINTGGQAQAIGCDGLPVAGFQFEQMGSSLTNTNGVSVHCSRQGTTP